MQMGDIGPCDESVFEAVDHKPCLNGPFHEHAVVGEDQFNCRYKEIMEMDLLMENLGISDEDDLNDEECENLHIKNTICSEALQSCPSIFAKVEPSIIKLGYESYAAASNAAKDSLVPYHESSKIVSAIKGSRAKALDPNVHVKWAANVYDPPVTSSSHTVKGHRHRLPKAKTWDHHKHKHMKAKPSNSSSGDRKKHSHRRSSSSILDPRMGRMQSLSRRYLQTGQALDNSTSTSGQESSSKCAGSFHAKSPWPLPLPFAEAS